MRLSVRFADKWFVIPCGEGENSIQWLVEETIRRSNGANMSEKLPFSAQNFEAVLAQGGGKLDPNDAINEVLKDNDFVHLSGKCDVCTILYSISVQSCVRSIDR